MRFSSSLRSVARLPPARSTPAASLLARRQPFLRACYGGTSGHTKGGSHGGQAPTDSNVGETGQTGPSSDNVAQSDAAFDSNPDPKSSGKQVDKDLPSNETMAQSGANSDMSKQFGDNSEGMTENLSTKKNTSDGPNANSRSSRGPGKDV